MKPGPGGQRAAPDASAALARFDPRPERHWFPSEEFPERRRRGVTRPGTWWGVVWEEPGSVDAVRFLFRVGKRSNVGDTEGV
ncbi:hypothetical protein GWI33_001544 [Rhynchophorus ferrugineus]|uniref:Uncharacterized protein n=1 Tax=Rhynchophorus ferrugineus TaxID=354439 RepID=A0A834ILA4_RHYFE|nr:hypothetical protein GWI33_001544 [Rhynchophorus ferrugineus]